MSGSANRWVLRLSTEGADQVIRDLRAAATESAAAGRAYDALIKAQPALATGAERAEQALRKNVDAMRGMRGELNLLGSATQGVASSLGSLGSALTSPAAAMTALGAASAAGVVQIARIGDEYTNTTNKLRAATGSVQAAGAVYAELVAMSQQTGASISESAGAFVRFSVAARAIGATNGEVLQLTRTIQQAGLISGASTQEAAAGMQQLGQALASGTLQGDELRSILENMPTLAEALATQLGVSIGQLRTMGSEGQLTSDRVFQALLRASEGINKQFNELTPTMGRAFGILGQAMVEFVGKLDQALGLSQAIARAAAGAAAAVGRVSGSIGPSSPAERVDAAEQRLRIMQEQLRQAEEALAEQRRQFVPRNATPERLAAAGRFADQDPLVQEQAQRIARLRQQMVAESQVLTQARTEQDQAARQADEVRQAEEASATARRAAAARATQTASFNATRDALDQERKLRADHAARITAIEAGLANGNTDAAGATRLRTLANEELADGLKSLDQAARGRVTTDEELAAVGRIVADIEKDRLALMRDGETVTAAARTEAEKYAEELGRLNNLLAAGAISQETYNRAVAAADPAIKAAAEASRRIEQENTRTTDRITGFFGDAFARAFEGTGNGFRGLMESFKKAAISTFASIAAQAIIRPIVAPIVQGLGLGQLGVGGGGALNLGGLFSGTAQAATPGAASAAGNGGGLGSVSSFGTLQTAFNGFTSPGGLGAFFPGGANVATGFGGLNNFLNTPLTSPGVLTQTGFVGAGGVPIVSGTPSLSIAGTLGPLAAIGGGAYGVYSGLQRGGVGGYTSAAGGAVSAITGLGMLGSAAGLLPALGALGPIGLGIGAVLAIAGSLLPGAKPSGMGQLARTNLNTGLETTEGLGGKRFSQANASAAGSTVDNIVSLAKEVGSKLGGASIGGDVAVGVTNGDIYLDVNGQKTRAANTEQGAKDIAAAAARMVLNEFNSQGTVQGDYAGILRASGDSVETLGANLEWYEKVYKSFGELTPAVSAFQQSMDALHTSMNAQIDKAHELGLSSDRLVDARGREVAKLLEQRDAQLANIKDTLEARAIEAGVRGGNADDNREAVRVRVETRNAAVEFERLKQELTALGLTSQDVTASMTEFRAIQWAEAYNSAEASREARKAAEEARKADDERRRAEGLAVQTDAERASSERQSALRQGGAGSALGVITNLRSYVSSLSTTGAGSGTAMDRLSATQRQFDAVFGAAAAGDAGSISGLQNAAEGYRAAAREVFGGGQGFADALRLIEQRIGSISNLGADALTASFMADNARANTDRIVDALAGLRRENAALRADLNMLLMRPAA